MVQELLPAVSSLNQKYAPPAFNPNQSTDSTTGNQAEQGLSACTTSNHYAVIESDHPYKQAGVTQYKVQHLSFTNQNAVCLSDLFKNMIPALVLGFLPRLCSLDDN